MPHAGEEEFQKQFTGRESKDLYPLPRPYVGEILSYTTTVCSQSLYLPHAVNSAKSNRADNKLAETNLFFLLESISKEKIVL